MACHICYSWWTNIETLFINQSPKFTWWFSLCCTDLRGFRNPWCSIFTLRVSPRIAAAAKSLQSCLTLCDPIDDSPPGSPILGILQARTLEWVAISFSNAWKWKVKGKSLSRVRLLETPWTAAYQAPRSMGFSRQEYWSGMPLPSPRPIVYRSINMWCMSFISWFPSSNRSFRVDTVKLQHRYQQLQRLVHPDFFSQRSQVSLLAIPNHSLDEEAPL